MAGLFPLLAAAVCAFAQTSPPPASVSGVVTNSVTGAPVLRAHVTLCVFANNGQRTYGALTNGEGKFTIAPLPPGRYNASVERVGFVERPSSDMGRSRDMNLGPGDKREDLQLTLTPTGAISGRVLDPGGEPVPGCSVSAESDAGGAASATTDDRGQFRIGGMAPGKYRILASPVSLPIPPEIRTDGTRDVHLARSWYPSSLDRKSAQRVDVGAAGDVTGIDIHLVETPVVSVSGKVIGGPEGRTTLQVRSIDGYGVGGGPVMANGSFRLWRLDPGKYTLFAATQGFGPDRLQSAPLDIEVAATDIEHVELRMIPPFEISGQLDFDDDGARQMPQMPVRPGQQQSAPKRRVMLGPAEDNSSYSPGSMQQVEVGADDSFTLEKVPPGRYRLRVSWGSYVKSVRQGPTETEGDILDVRNGPNGPLTLRVGSVMAEVSGTVADSGGPASGVPVALLLDAPGIRVQLSTVTDKDGVYRFQSVTPGKYWLLAAGDDIISQIRRSEDADEFKDIVEVIEVHAGDKLTQNLTRR
jgi:hypothetical protein